MGRRHHYRTGIYDLHAYINAIGACRLSEDQISSKSIMFIKANAYRASRSETVRPKLMDRTHYYLFIVSRCSHYYAAYHGDSIYIYIYIIHMEKRAQAGIRAAEHLRAD